MRKVEFLSGFFAAAMSVVMLTGIMEVQADSDIETGEPLKLDPKESKTFTVKLVGKKNSDEDFINTKPLSVYGWITQIGEQ